MPGTSSATVSTQRVPGNGVDTGASGAERRSLRPRARPTTVCSIEELLSTRSSLSESRVSAFPRLPGSRGLPGTPPPAGSRRRRTLAAVSTVHESVDSASMSSRPMRFAPSSAARHRQPGSSSPSKSRLDSGPPPSSDVEATGTPLPSCAMLRTGWISSVFP